MMIISLNIIGILIVIFIIAGMDINAYNNSNIGKQQWHPAVTHEQQDTVGRDCTRTCKFGAKPKRCVYTFEAHIEDINGRLQMTINHQIPAPTIEVCHNDVINVDVVNKLIDQDLTIHWHGIEQEGTPHMDGVPMITQCPILEGTSYRYTFRANAPGTYFYHSFSVSQQADGMFGALIVKQPSILDVDSESYDHDLPTEHTLLISALYNTTTSDRNTLIPTQATQIQINGRTDSFILTVNQGDNYRVRFINAIPFECHVRVNIDSHTMTIIASDGRRLKHYITDAFNILPGERIDIILSANQSVKSYWLHVQTSGEMCTGLVGNAIIQYNGTLYNNQTIMNREAVTPRSSIYSQHLRSSMEPPVSVTSNNGIYNKVYLTINKNIIDTNDLDSDFRYLSDAIPVPAFTPSQLILKNSKLVQMNKKNFLYPNSPLLTQADDVLNRIYCDVSDEVIHQDIQCLLKLDIPIGTVADIFIINEDTESYTLHIHGKQLYIMAQGDLIKSTTTVQQLRILDEQNKIKRNLNEPPQKDTFNVPAMGYINARLIINNPGVWLIECRSCGFQSLPVAALINTSMNRIPKSISSVLPKCGNYRPPDILLN